MNEETLKRCLREQNRYLRSDNLLAVSFVHTLLGAILIIGVVTAAGDLFDDVEVDSGVHHYAESLSAFSTSLLPMPFNTVVNVGYVAVGIFWILRVRGSLARGTMSVSAAYLLYVFSWMSVIYGPVQLTRVLTQWHAAGILDQWFTLPIFAWVGVSCRQLRSTSCECNAWSMGLIMTVSVGSYGLAVMHSIGFEVALAAHIIGVILQAWWIHRQRSLVGSVIDQHRRREAFVRAVISCAGFVSLKLLDWPLVRLFPMPFAVLSGHFWSKIADFMQVHYSCKFLEACLPSHHSSETEGVSDYYKHK